MNYILIIILFIINQNDASENLQNKRSIDDSFNVNIGAGYSVGLDQLSNNDPPNGTSNIKLSKNYYSSNLKTEGVPRTSVRGPRILANYTPQVGNPIIEIPKRQASVPNSGYKEHYSASPSNIHSYNAPFRQSEDFEEPNLVDFQNILNKVESKKPFSKILQVIKVPAIYEIHFQSDDNTQKKVNLNPTGNLFWKNYFEDKANATQYSDDYSEWLNNAHLQEDPKWINNAYLHEEKHPSQNDEKYYDFSDTPVVSYENLHESFDNKPKGHSVLHPTITHHYSNTRTFPNGHNDKDVRINHSSESFYKPIWINKDYHRNKKQPYAVNNFKRHIVYNQRGTNPTGQALQNEILNNYTPNVKNTTPFWHNQVITEDHKPQALHEVPAPFLGKYPQPKPFEIQKLSEINPYPTPTTLYKQTKVKFSKVSPSPTKSVFSYKNLNGFLDPESSNSFRKTNTVTKPTPYIKGNQNLIYGKKTDQVLTPYEINIPVTPGSTMVTVTENPYSSGKNFHYSTTIKRNTNSIGFEKPETVHTFNDQYKQVAEQNSKRINQNFQYPVDSENNMNTFIAVDMTEKGSNQNTFQNPDTSTNSINSFSSESPEIVDNKLSNYYQQVVDIPYQTQKSIISTTSVPEMVMVKANTFASSPKIPEEVSHNGQSEQTTKRNIIDQNIDTKGGFLEVTAPTFTSESNIRRRVFNPDYNVNNSFNKKYINNGYTKTSQHYRISKRKSSGPRLDSIIYITRKSTH